MSAMMLNIVFFLISLMVLAVMYLFLRRRIDRLTDSERISEALSGDLDVILAEINQATERNILIIEDKIRELEEIIKTAEKRITLLRKAVPVEPAAKSLSGQAAEHKATVSDDSAERRQQPSNVRVDNERNAAGKANDQLLFEIPDQTGPEKNISELTYSHLNKMNTMSGMVTSLKVPEKKINESIDLKEKIIELHKSGIDSTIIASKLGVNRGEVDLIISLYMQTGYGHD